MEKITAKSNNKIKYAVKLSTSSAARRENGEFFLEGARLCSDAAKSDTEIVRAFFTEEALSKYSDYIGVITGVCSDCCLISDDIAGRLSDTGSSQGVFCICKMKENKGELNTKGKYIALENIQDPSNFGAVCRTAEALGTDGLIIAGGCDLYNPKALRAAMGSSLRMKIIETDNLPCFINQANNGGMQTLACVPAKDALDIRKVDMSGGVIGCIGNEGNGLTDETINACSHRVTIPMEGRAESLNASVAASIVAWELKR